jgi:hypothetical protein
MDRATKFATDGYGKQGERTLSAQTVQKRRGIERLVILCVASSVEFRKHILDEAAGEQIKSPAQALIAAISASFPSIFITRFRL